MVDKVNDLTSVLEELQLTNDEHERGKSADKTDGRDRVISDDEHDGSQENVYNGAEAGVRETEAEPDVFTCWTPERIIALANSGSLVPSLNRMTADELRLRLDAAKLNTKGNKQVMKSRLKEWLQRRAAIEEARARGEEDPFIPVVRRGPRPRTKHPQKQAHEYLLVVDFEATCDVSNDGYAHEIIEFPVVCVDTARMEVVSEYRRYCRPVINPVLSDFCVGLTGITQDMVDSAEEFPAVFAEFERWMEDLGLGSQHTFAFVTDGPWDFLRFFYMQCLQCGIPYPPYAYKWIDIRRSFGRCYGVRGGLTYMVQHVGLQMGGKLHCGLDDARNIAQIVIRIIQDGFWLDTNDKLPAKMRHCEAGGAEQPPMQAG